ncbi:MAG: glycine--tRNA ligase subunit beta, partial [Elusimicrobiota bacterium]
FEKIIRGINFKKMMVCESSGFTFARPIRNIVALYGSKVVRLSVAGVKSQSKTPGLYVISSKKVKITEPKKYLSILRNNYIIADQKKRAEIIKELTQQVLKKISRPAPQPALTDDLLQEINFLVESPVAMLCSFDEKYLFLPEEIIVNCIRKQKFIPVYSAEKISNYFVGIRNGISEHQETVRDGYQKVLTARLSDAEYFFNTDLKAPLYDRYKRLVEITFQEKLGTMQDKTQRIEELALWIYHALPHDFPGKDGKSLEDVLRTASLCKTDLLTSLVYEYPELEGIAGRIYADFSGENKLVAEGIEEHYLPLSSQGKLPETITGTVVSLADKIDTLVGDFAVGLIPSGSADPYALRRQAAGVIRIMIEKGADISLKKLVLKAMDLLPATLISEREKVIDLLFDFFRQRFETILQERGFKFDEIRAVLSCGFERPSDALKRLEALSAIRRENDFAPLISGYKRAANIVRQAQQKNISFNKDGAVQEVLLKEEEEKTLYQLVIKIESGITPLLEERNYHNVLLRLVSLRTPIDTFFEKVMVMADDPEIRANRLSLLKKIVFLFLKIADLSLLQ